MIVVSRRATRRRRDATALFPQRRFEFFKLRFKLADAVALKTWCCRFADKVVAAAPLACPPEGCIDIALDLETVAFFTSAIPFPDAVVSAWERHDTGMRDDTGGWNSVSHVKFEADMAPGPVGLCNPCIWENRSVID
jgi:hypothetical protein